MAEKVYRDYTQEELDHAYNARATVDDFDAVVAHWVSISEATREKLRVERDLSFGPMAEEVMDIFPAGGPDAPFHLFIHGGYWRALTKEESSFAANALAPAGASVAINSYTLAPAVRIGEIVEQCRRAVITLYESGTEYGDVGRIYVSGHSAGGQLAAMMMATDWTQYGLPEDLIKGGTVISGIFDMEAMQKCFVNEWLQLTDAEVEEFSPQRHPPATQCPVIVTYGDADPSGFHVQAAEYRDLLEGNGNPVTFIEQKGANHFDAGEALHDPKSELVRAVKQQMGL